MSRTVPVLALSDPVLYSACLAYASRVLHLLGRLDKEIEEKYSNGALTFSHPQAFGRSAHMVCRLRTFDDCIAAGFGAILGKSVTTSSTI